MKGKWKVTTNRIGGEIMYRAVRLIDINELEHSGNREFYGHYINDKKEVERNVKKLNEE